MEPFAKFRLGDDETRNLLYATAVSASLLVILILITALIVDVERLKRAIRPRVAFSRSMSAVLHPGDADAIQASESPLETPLAGSRRFFED